MKPSVKSFTHSGVYSDNILNQTIYNPSSEMPLSQKFWWEAFGMFFLILLICSMNPFYNFDYWLTSLLPIAIMLSVKQSGAHYNPSMSFSNFFIVFSPTKFSPNFMWTYFKAEFFPAFIAFNLVYFWRNNYAPAWTPSNGIEEIRIVLSQMIGTFMLVVMLQKTCNSLTTFATSEMQTYGFVVVFVFVARRFAVSSGNSINPVATLAGACAAVFHCNFAAVKTFYLYLLGDFIGSCLGTWFYNRMLWPALQKSRKQNKINDKFRTSEETLSKVIKQLAPMNRQSSLDLNKITKIEYKEQQHSDSQNQIYIPSNRKLSENVREVSDLVNFPSKDHI